MKRQVFFHLAEFQNGFLCFVFFNGFLSSLPMLLIIFFSHVGKRSNSCSQMVFFTTGVLKNFAIFTGKRLYWKTPVLSKFSISPCFNRIDFLVIPSDIELLTAVTLKGLRGQFDHPLWLYQKCVFQREGETLVLGDVIIISHLENFIEIHQAVKKI